MSFQGQGNSHGLPVDIHADIFRNVLMDVRFQAWQRPHRRWQLHISGGPGSGKTTLANLIARQLRATGMGYVGLIHINDDASVKIREFHSLHHFAPSNSHSLGLGRLLLNQHDSLKVEPIDSTPSEFDIQELCADLATLLRGLDEVCLIIDGYDRLEPSLQASLQENLRSPEMQDLRVLLLSASSELVPFPPAYLIFCDNCGRGKNGQDGLKIYWTCDLCEYDICDTCKSSGNHCQNSQHLLSEPYNAVNMRFRSVPSELKNFVRTDLEAEYGAKIDDKLVEAIYDPSDGNVNIAKLRLDQIRDLVAPQDILSASDRLPREVVAFFDAQIKLISALEPQQRYQTLLAIVAVAATDWMSVSKLEDLLSRIAVSELQGREGRYIRVQHVLRSARGLLSSFVFRGHMASGQQDSERHRISLYIRDLGWYVREDYNQDLILVKQYFSQAQTRQGNLDRAYSFGRSINPRQEHPHVHKTIPPKVQYTKNKASQAATENIVDAIVRDPGDLCALCQEMVFRSKSNSGARTWTRRYFKERCRICFSAYGQMKDMALNAMEFHWTRRAMGRTSNADNCLVLTLQTDALLAQPTFQRFVFILRSDFESSFVSNKLAASTAIEHTGQQIKRWLQVCRTEHAHCSCTNVKSYVPKRLVDIDAEGEKPCRVIRGDKIEGPYVTLSHSWGRNPDFLTLTTRNMDQLMGQGFSVSELKNKNFEHAIEVTRYLGIRYIWIDSLCICQAGKNKDFKDEGQYMHQIYQSSFCNIVAAYSRDANDGLFKDRPSDFLSGLSFKESWTMLDKDLWEKELLQSPIYTRGWVFQERMLSPRIIHFTRTQVFWECSTISACETLPEGLPFALSARATTDRRWRGRLQRQRSGREVSTSGVEDSLESFWKAAVLNYTSCDLTNQADKTTAIWSVAKLVRDDLPTDQYGCGLWSVALHEQLAWQVKAIKKDARTAILQSAFPSWSWASVKAPIQIQDRIVMKRSYTVKDHEGNPLSFSDFKDKALDRNLQPQFVASDSLAVRGYIIQSQLVQQPSHGRCTLEHKETRLPAIDEIVLDEQLSEAVLNSWSFYLLPLFVGRTSDDEATYSGSALVLTTTQDYRQLVNLKLMRQLLALVRLNCATVGRFQNDSKSEVRMLRTSIGALNACLHKIAKQNRNLPNRKDNAFRRIGVARFHNIVAKEWAKIDRMTEKNIWLD